MDSDDKKPTQLTRVTSLSDSDLFIVSIDIGTAPKTRAIEKSKAIIATSDGWILVSDTWTRTGNHTFTVSGNVTTTYRKGAKVRYKDGGGYEYGTILSSAYSSPNTTITLFTNSDYAMAATTITDKYLSYVQNPEGFPHIFNYTPSWNNLTIGNGTLYGKFMVDGRKLVQIAGIVFGSTTTITAASILNLNYLVVPSSLGTAQEWFGTTTIRDTGTAIYEGVVYLISGALYPQVNAASGAYGSPANVTPTVPMTWTTADEISMSCQFMY